MKIRQIKNEEGVELSVLQNQLIGRGPLGQVYSCFLNTSPHSIMAVKVVKKQYSKYFNVDSRIDSHKNILKYQDTFLQSQNNRYFKIQRCDCNLNRFLTTRTMSPDQFVSLFRDVVSGLWHIFQQGYLHRNIKPENILFKKDRFVLVDFRIGKCNYPMGLAASSLIYKSKDNFYQDRGQTPLTDIYSLGVVLFMALTGHHPYLEKQTPQSQDQYLKLLQTAKALHVGMQYDLKIQPLLEGVYKMIEKQPKNRMTSFQLRQLLSYAQKLTPKTVEFREQKKKLNSCVFVQYRESLILSQGSLNFQQSLQKDQQLCAFLQRRRLVVFVLDRLARVLYSLLDGQPFFNSSELILLIFSIRYLSLSLLKISLTKWSPFSQQVWNKCKMNPSTRLSNLLRLFQQRDQQQIQLSIEQMIIEYPRSKQLMKKVFVIMEQKNSLQLLAKQTNRLMRQFLCLFHYRIDFVRSSRRIVLMLDYMSRLMEVTQHSWDPYLDLNFFPQDFVRTVELEDFEGKADRVVKWLVDQGVQYSVTLSEGRNRIIN